MKKTITVSSILFLLIFINACSQVSQRSTSQSRATYTQENIQNKQRNSHKISRHNERYQQTPLLTNHSGRNLMVRIAQSTIGTPYKWGGNSPRRGFDCSGLMTYIHKNALGIKIPRIAAQQRDRSRTISYEQLQPGDMLFFKTGTKTNHVGIYIGDRRFIHAPSGGKKVKVSSMNSSYWHKRFVKFGTFI